MPERDVLRNLIRPLEDEAPHIRSLWSAWLRVTQGEVDPAQAEEADRYSRLGTIQLTWPDGRPRELPPSVTRGLYAVLGTLAQGDAVAVVPADNELTTQEAADLLGISRPSLVRLIDQQKLPCRWVGAHRRLRVEDVLAYRRIRKLEQREKLGEVIGENEQLGLRYATRENELEQHRSAAGRGRRGADD
jgi:excisionase family DNA binding protein